MNGHASSDAKEESTSPPLQLLGGSHVALENRVKSDVKTSAEAKKRKKAARACNHCQTAHLTCDDSRPCERCVKRNLGDSCQDGARKKAKYLRDIEDDLVNAGKVHPTPFLTDKPASPLPPLPPEASPPNSAAPAAFSLQLTQSPSHFNSQPLPHANSASQPVDGLDQSSAAALNRVIEALTSSATNQASTANSMGAGNNNNSNTLGSFDFLGDFNLGSEFGSNSVNLEYAVLSSMLQNSGYGSNTPASFTSGLPNQSAGDNMQFSRQAPVTNGVFPSLHSMYSNDESDTSRQSQPQAQESSAKEHERSQAQTAFAFPSPAFGSNAISLNSRSGVGERSADKLTEGHTHEQQQSEPRALEARHSLSMGLPHSQSPSQPTAQSIPSTSQNSAPSENTAGQSLTNPNGSSFSGQSRSFSSALDWNNSKPSAGLAAPATNVQRSHRQLGPQRKGSAHQGSAQSEQQPRHALPAQPATDTQAQQAVHQIKPVTSSSGVMRVEDVYKLVNKPYNYLEAYHALIRYLQNNFQNRSFVLRIIRALSIYRPSLIALQMPLTTDDEIFIERSFQRTLIELEKLISFSGTPTIVFRRTGEIVLVGTEFTMLSEWRRDELLFREAESNPVDSTTGKKKKGRRRYIFEIFDQESCVEYYESFAAHAFESSSSTIMHTCNLVTPKGRKVPCTFAYTLKRDIFGLPSMVIGQFLPILTIAT